MDDAGPLAKTSAASRLRSCKRDVLDRWTRRVLDDPRAPAPRRGERPVLVDAAPALLEHLIEALAASRLAGEDAALRGAYERVEDHARRCVTRGRCIEAALRELSHLRAALIEECVAQGIALGAGEAQVLHAVVDASMWTSALEVERATRAGVPIRLDLRGSGAGLWDPERIAQMVTNLVQNAVDHAEPGSAVRVAIRPRGGDVLIEVHNEGPEIAPERLATLFEPWQQASPAEGRASAGRGLGLGLFIAHQIARAHGGVIEVASQAERGTTFTARLPRRGAAARG
ncbi:ATP-binding protein [Sorangium sp. So ce448]|uniref:ATP-binding protein n=1 Tax=Sorangium sp. So ce448 TaxID=3133314 RepID=UPI003F629E61